MISLGKNEIYPISIHRGYDKLHLEPGVNHWPMSKRANVWYAEEILDTVFNVVEQEVEFTIRHAMKIN